MISVIEGKGREYDREPVEALLRGAVRRRCDFYWPKQEN